VCHSCRLGRDTLNVCVLLIAMVRSLVPAASHENQAQTSILYSNYRVLFERAQDPASGGSFLYHNGELAMVFQKASDGDSGVECGSHPGQIR